MDIARAIQHLNFKATTIGAKVKSRAEKISHKIMIDVPKHGMHVFAIGHKEALTEKKMDAYWARAMRVLKCG